MRMISEANRIRLFNKALGTHEIDLSPYPVDFVETVVQWAIHGKLDHD